MLPRPRTDLLTTALQRSALVPLCQCMFNDRAVKITPSLLTARFFQEKPTLLRAHSLYGRPWSFEALSRRSSCVDADVSNETESRLCSPTSHHPTRDPFDPGKLIRAGRKSQQRSIRTRPSSTTGHTFSRSNEARSRDGAESLTHRALCRVTARLAVAPLTTAHSPRNMQYRPLCMASIRSASQARLRR